MIDAAASGTSRYADASRRRNVVARLPLCEQANCRRMLRLLRSIGYAEGSNAACAQVGKAA